MDMWNHETSRVATAAAYFYGGQVAHVESTTTGLWREIIMTDGRRLRVNPEHMHSLAVDEARTMRKLGTLL